MMTIDEKTVGVWILRTLETQDYMAHIRELVAEEKYELTYRFRNYKDDKVFGSEDEKNWYKGQLSGTRNYVLGAFCQVMAIMEVRAIGKVHEILMRNGDVEDFQRRLMDAPGIYTRMASAEEVDEVERNQ